MKFTNKQRRKRIHQRVRKIVKGDTTRPRLNVFRSNVYIYAQLIDDTNSHTLISASSKEKEFESFEGDKKEASYKVGELIAERALEKGIQTCTFDRGGYLYHGRVKSLAEGARAKGLKF